MKRGTERVALRAILYAGTAWCFLFLIFQGTSSLPLNPTAAIATEIPRVGIALIFAVGLAGLAASARQGD